MQNGTLTLIPTPIDETSKLTTEAFSQLIEVTKIENRDKNLIVVEDLKPARKRWLSFGLPRESIELFKQLNEHNFKESTTELILELKSGKNVFLMSDGGMPAFCDPGQELVYQCHKNKIKVTSFPFSNSVILALALSGLCHKKFIFHGFMPLDNLEREQLLQSILKQKLTCILMDTPYRLKRLLEELESIEKMGKSSNMQYFVALDLNQMTEELILGTPTEMLKRIKDIKREFVMVIGEANTNKI